MTDSTLPSEQCADTSSLIPTAVTQTQQVSVDGYDLWISDDGIQTIFVDTGADELEQISQRLVAPTEPGTKKILSLRQLSISVGDSFFVIRK